MRLYSTNNRGHVVGLREAVLHSFPPDRGLYMPESLPSFPHALMADLHRLDFPSIALLVGQAIIGPEIPGGELSRMTSEALDFPAPVVMLHERLGALELWHGPSLAFKDFGARYMAALMSWFNRHEDRPLTILVATSGDTGGAVAAGFHRVPGIEVAILYPSGKVSALQEKQLTTLGDNIRAIKVNGTFDDCQAIVKNAFLDPDLNARYRLSSANSINIARLIPQSFYYFEAYKQIAQSGLKPVFSVPSGNFGNLCAGLMAKRMGLPIERFVAATNINKIVPDYLATGIYEPKPSQPTISNAMDVGAPSNFVRILELYKGDWNAIRADVSGFYLDDAQTRQAMRDAYARYAYLCDPHGAIGYQSLRHLNAGEIGVFLETAHPAKFLETMEETLGTSIPLPPALAALANKTVRCDQIEPSFDDFKTLMLS